MNPEALVQRRLDACNARDLGRVVAQHSDNVQLYRPPRAEPVMRGKAAGVFQVSDGLSNSARFHDTE